MLGIDIVRIARIEQLLQRHPRRALERFLCPEEIALARTAQSVAGFYAAKEAVSKALGSGIGPACGFHDIRIHKAPGGAPYFTLTRSIVERYEITETALSITHDGAYAIAVATIMTTGAPDRPLCH